MKMYLIILFISAILLGIGANLQKTRRAQYSSLNIIEVFKENYFKRFSSKEPPHFTWNLVFGKKEFIRPQLRKSIKDLRLGFLFSLSSLHLGSFLFFFKFRKLKKKYRKFYYPILFFLFFLPSNTLKRIIFLKIFHALNQHLKLKLKSEQIFFITFSILSYQFLSNPMSYTYSFLFIGTFLSFRFDSKTRLILAQAGIQILIGLFTHSTFSILSIILNSPIILILTIAHPILLFSVLIHKIYFINITPFIKIIINCILLERKILESNFFDCSFFFLISILLLMSKNLKQLGAVLLFFVTKMVF